MKKLLWMSVLAIGLGLGWRAWQGTTTSDGGDPKLLFDRLWVDHLPRSERDTVQVFVAVTEQPVGVFENRARWKGAWEVFRYERRSNDQIDFLFPHTRDRERAGYRASRCHQDGFDFCLELAGASRGTQRYYSRKGWEIGQVKTPAALLDQVGHLEQLVDEAAGLKPEGEQ